MKQIILIIILKTLIIINLERFRLNYKETQLLSPIQIKVIKSATITVPLKYLSSFWRSLKMPLINRKIELKLKWIKYCVLSAACYDNTNANLNNIIFNIKDTKLYVTVVTLSAKDN